MSQSESAKRGKWKIYREKSRHSATRQLTFAARFLSKEYPCSLVLAAFLMLAIDAPAQADAPCDGGDDAFARPIAKALQSKGSAFDPDGRFEVTLQTSTGTTFPTDVYLRHVRGGSELFRTVNRVQSEIRTATVGLLPASEGPGFSLQISEGGSGYNQICTYGFRFQNGAVFYRTLTASAASRSVETGIWSGYIFPGEVTNWKSVLVQAQQPPPPAVVDNSAAAPRTAAVTTNNKATPAVPGTFDCPQSELPAHVPAASTAMLSNPTQTQIVELADHFGLGQRYGISGAELRLVTRELESGVTKQTLARYEVGARAAPYAYLSESVYHFVEAVDTDGDGLMEWRIDKDLSTTNINGFRGAAYVNRETSEVVVAFAGTNPIDARDLANDIRGAVFSDVQIGGAQRLTDRALAKYASPTWKVRLTGHSLGGRLAQLATAALGSAGYHLEAFTFHTAAVAGSDFTKLRSPWTRGITNIVTRADPVNSLSQIAGTGVNVGRDVCFDFGDRGSFLNNHDISRLRASLDGVRRLYQDRMLPAENLLTAYFKGFGDSPKIKNQNGVLSIELIDRDGLFSYYESKPTTETEVWDAIFLDLCVVDSPSDPEFVGQCKQHLPILLRSYAAVCGPPTSLAVRPKCVFDQLAGRNKLRVGGGRYDEGYRCLSWRDSKEKFDSAKNCKPY